MGHAFVTGIKDDDNRDKKIKGDTDDTLIGNTGDCLNVQVCNDDISIDPAPASVILWIDNSFLNGSNENLDVNGSSTTQNFLFGPPSGQVWYVEEVSIVILDPGTSDIDDFGSISGGLTNGLQLLAEISSTEYEIGNYQNNGTLSLGFANHAVFGQTTGEGGAGWFDEDDAFMGVQKFRKPVCLNGTNGDQLIFRVRDNLNNIQRIKASAKAWRKLP